MGKEQASFSERGDRYRNNAAPVREGRRCCVRTDRRYFLVEKNRNIYEYGCLNVHCAENAGEPD